MKMSMILAAAALAGLSAPASAAVLNFHLTGLAEARFQLDSEQLPDYTDEAEGLLGYAGIQGDFGGEDFADFITFYLSGSGGGIDIAVGGDTFASALGDQLFTGTLDLPRFAVGEYELTDLSGAGSYRLSITAVPEPATWAMMMIGFGAVGTAVRRRRSEPSMA